MAQCTAALAGEPLLRCILREGHTGLHEAVNLARRATYHWPVGEGIVEVRDIA